LNVSGDHNHKPHTGTLDATKSAAVAQVVTHDDDDDDDDNGRYVRCEFGRALLFRPELFVIKEEVFSSVTIPIPLSARSLRVQ
jgi:hypothetical protein